jgi:hypothetical protein
MKQLILIIMLILSALSLNAQSKFLIETSDEVIDKSMIDNVIKKRTAVINYE